MVLNKYNVVAPLTAVICKVAQEVVQDLVLQIMYAKEILTRLGPIFLHVVLARLEIPALEWKLAAV